MKKVLATLLVGGMFAIYACGPSAEETEKKRIADSTAAADSMKTAADAAAAAMPAAAPADSNAMPADTTKK